MSPKQSSTLPMLMLEPSSSLESSSPLLMGVLRSIMEVHSVSMPDP